MLSQDKKPLALLFFLVLLFGTWLIWLPTLNGKDATTLTVTFLDVGQGDAIFIETPSGRQILIDGGRDNSVLRELGKVMSFLDRSIDIVVATHPDADHITGLIEVFKRYEISTFLRPGVKHDTPATQSLFSTLGSEIQKKYSHVVDRYSILVTGCIYVYCFLTGMFQIWSQMRRQ
ncbi:MAG: MBL fold metallo-hydrolase [Candidatus Pacebacteria bacterium]|nr:MBL fold metallo-hydrolase [Candidatus Paceibacterota bacterium]